ncbi:hypothetical protein TNCV_3355031 [Trichonephila clavipes]|nr:hypothetical protein TNCV_3355031 [Trichonephila clavipes]
MYPHLTFTAKSWKFMLKEQRADNMLRNGDAFFNQTDRMSKTTIQQGTVGQVLQRQKARRCHTPGLDLQTTVAGKFPSRNMSRRSRERAATDKEKLYPLHKSHTTQVTTSKARQGNTS